MFASKVTDLAGCWSADVARVVLAAVSGVEMAHSSAAVAVGWNGQGVDVVDEGAVGCFVRETGEVHVDHDAWSVGRGGDGDGAFDC